MNAKKELKEVGKNIVMPAKKVGEIGEDVVKAVSKPFIQDKRKLTIGQRTADGLAKWAGSWTFILSFLTFLTLWMILNTYIWIIYFSGDPFDPYPYILLNLVLSCLAALQAPIILILAMLSCTHRRVIFMCVQIEQFLPRCREGNLGRFVLIRVRLIGVLQNGG